MYYIVLHVYSITSSVCRRQTEPLSFNVGGYLLLKTFPGSFSQKTVGLLLLPLLLLMLFASKRRPEAILFGEMLRRLLCLLLCCVVVVVAVVCALPVRWCCLFMCRAYKHEEGLQMLQFWEKKAVFVKLHLMVHELTTFKTYF